MKTTSLIKDYERYVWMSKLSSPQSWHDLGCNDRIHVESYLSNSFGYGIICWAISLIHVGLKVLGVVHDLDEVVASDDVGGITGASDPPNKPNDESKDKQRDQYPADYATTLVRLALLPVISGGTLCVWVNVKRIHLNILFYSQAQTATYTRARQHSRNHIYGFYR